MSRKSEMRIARRIIRYEREYQNVRNAKGNTVFFIFVGIMLLVIGAWAVSHGLSMSEWPTENLNLNSSMTKPEWVMPNIIQTLLFGGLLAIVVGMIFSVWGVLDYYHNIDEWDKIKNKYN